MRTSTEQRARAMAGDLVLAEMDTDALRRKHAGLMEALRQNDRKWVTTKSARVRRRLDAEKEKAWTKISDVNNEIASRGDKVYAENYDRYCDEFRAAARGVRGSSSR